MMHTLRIALRMLGRDWKAGELRVLAAAIIIGVGAVTAIGLFSDRVNRAMIVRAAELLGADLVISSPREVSEAWVEHAVGTGLSSTTTLEFASMVRARTEMVLASVKAVSLGYPLRGNMRTARVPYDPGVETRDVPEAGTVWVEGRMTGILGINTGATLRIGDADFEVTRILSFEPGRGGNFYSMAPRVLMNLEDVARTRVVQPGSRLTWRYLFAGAQTQIDDFTEWVRPQLDTSEKLIGVREGNPAARGALRNMERYLNLASLIAVALAGVAIAMGTRRYSERHTDHCALLRCFGASGAQVFHIYVLQLFMLGLVASLIGSIVGWTAHDLMILWLRELLPPDIPSPGNAPAILGICTGLVILPGFGLPAVMRLRRVPVMRVIRRDMQVFSVGTGVSVLTAIGVLWALAWWFSGDLRLSLLVVTGGAFVALLLGLASYLALRAARGARALAPGAWKFGLQGVLRHPLTSSTQVLAFSLAFMAMGLVGMLRADLISTWQSQLPENAPNQFAVNIFPEEKDPVETFLAREGVAVENFYPIVRGRLVEINGEPVRQAVTKEQADMRAVNRELNLTWADQLQIGSSVVEGRWWTKGDGLNSVSVESLLARRLGIELGDQLGFRIGAREVTVTVASLREVEWGSFRPNFYMIFPPGLLQGFPVTYITSFHLPGGKREVLNELVAEFPAVTLLDVEQIMGQMRGLMDQVSMAIEYVLLFVLAAGFAVLAASVISTLDERMYEGAVMRALGANRRRIRGQQITEFLILGLVAGLLAAAGAELILWQLYTRVFDLDYSWQWPLWLILPLASAISVGVGGALGTRKVVDVPPVQVLREL